MATSGDTKERDTVLEQILDDYLAQLANGQQPDKDRIFREHPDHAEALRGVFRTLDLIEASGRSLRAQRFECGEELGDFRILSELGRGGMGVVYEAEQLSLGRRVALKVLAPAAYLAEHARERFRRETTTAGQLHHRHIVAVHAAGEEGGIPYYAMQLLEGRSLAEYCSESDGARHFRRVAEWGRQAATALAYAHDHGVVHRDIKPSNLLLDAGSEVSVSDFGLARSDATGTITACGDVVGTARYMSPEQVRGLAVDARTDIYALGTTLYELLCGEPAFAGETRDEVLNQVLLSRPLDLRRRDRTIPKDLATIVMHAMCVEAKDRYAHAGDLAADLRRFLAGEPIQARRPSLLRRALLGAKRHPMGIAASALVLGVIVAGLVMFRTGRKQRAAALVGQAVALILHDGAFVRAERVLAEATDLGASAEQTAFPTALMHVLSGRALVALRELRAIVGREPSNLEARLALALAHVRSGDFAEGALVLERVPTERIETALGWLLHGLASSQTQGSAAIRSFDRAIALRSDFVPAIQSRAFYRGSRLLAEGARDQLEPMLRDYDALLVFRPTAHSHALRAFGRLAAAAFAATDAALAAEGQAWLAGARDDVRRALAMRKPSESSPLLIQGELARFTGDFDVARAAYGEAVTVERDAGRPVGSELLHLLALTLHATGELEEALRVIEPACTASPSYYPLALDRALVLAELGRIDEARAVGRDAMARQSGNATALCLAAAVLELCGDQAFVGTTLSRIRADSVGSEHASNTTARRALAYLRGKIDGAALLGAAGVDPGSRCELALLVALRRYARSDRAGAGVALRACLDTGVLRYGEHRFAQMIRERVRRESDWPPWVN